MTKYSLNIIDYAPHKSKKADTTYLHLSCSSTYPASSEELSPGPFAWPVFGMAAPELSWVLVTQLILVVKSSSKFSWIGRTTSFWGGPPSIFGDVMGFAVGKV